MQVVEGLAGGKIAVLAKVHHSMVDGVGGADMMVHLFDPRAGDGVRGTADDCRPRSGCRPTGSW